MYIETFKAALADLYATKDIVAFINTVLTAIFGNIAKEEGYEYPVA